MLIVSLAGTLLNKLSTSTLASLILVSNCWRLIKFANEKVSLIISSELHNGWSNGTKNLASLYLWELTADSTGLKGTSFLCIFGKPYNFPRLVPDARRCS